MRAIRFYLAAIALLPIMIFVAFVAAYTAEAQNFRPGFAPGFRSGFQFLGSSAAVTMPPGALGIYYMDQAATSPRKYVPNTVATNAVSPSIIGPSRGNMFYSWTQNGTFTVTDNALAGPDGNTRASTVKTAGTSGWFLYASIDGGTAPAGPYTMCLDYTLNGTDTPNAAFGFKSNNQLVTLSPTSSWQHACISRTLSSAERYFCLIAADGSGAMSIAVDNVAVYQGLSPPTGDGLGFPTLSAHLYLGTSLNNSNITVSGGYVDMSSATGTYGYIQTPAPVTFTGMTVIAIASQVAARTTFQPIFSSVKTYSNLTSEFYHSYTGSVTSNTTYQPEIYYAGSAGFVDINYYDMKTNLSAGYRTYGQRLNSSTGLIDQFVNDARIISYPYSTATATTTAQDFYFGSLSGNGAFTLGSSYGIGFRVAALGVWPRALSDTEYSNAVTLMQNHVIASGIALPQTVNRILNSEEDSISGQNADGSWTSLLAYNASPTFDIAGKAAHGGGALGGPNGGGPNINPINGVGNTSYARQAADLQLCAIGKQSGRKVIFTYMGGANDLGSGYTSASTFASDVASYLDQMRAGGCKVVLFTVTPRSGEATDGSAIQDQYNAIIRGASFSSHYDALVDLPTLDTSGNNYFVNSAGNNTSYYTDGLHPSKLVSGVIANLAQPIINGL